MRSTRLLAIVALALIFSLGCNATSTTREVEVPVDAVVSATHKPSGTITQFTLKAISAQPQSVFIGVYLPGGEAATQIQIGSNFKMGTSQDPITVEPKQLKLQENKAVFRLVNAAKYTIEVIPTTTHQLPLGK